MRLYLQTVPLRSGWVCAAWYAGLASEGAPVAAAGSSWPRPPGRGTSRRSSPAGRPPPSQPGTWGSSGAAARAAEPVNKEQRP